MSGPKVSDYDFDYDYYIELREKEQRFNQLMKSERERIKAVEREICTLEQAVSDFKFKMQEYKRQCNLRKEKYKGDADTLEKIENTYSIFLAQCKSMISSIDRSSTEGITDGINKLKNTDCFDAFLESMNEVCKLKENSNDTQFTVPKSIAIRCEIRETVAEKSFTEILDELEMEKNKDIINRASILLLEADQLLSNDIYLASDEADLTEISEKLQSIVDGNVSEETESYLNSKAVVLKGIDKYAKMYKEYQTYMFSSKLIPINIKSFYNIDELKRQVEITRKEYLEREKALYVSAAINEVMQSFGYDVLDDVCVKGTTFTDPGISDCIYQNEDGTNIRSFVNPIGITVMEIVGDSSTEEQRKARYNEQVAFCRLFPEIITELESRYGIVLNKVDHQEPQMGCKEIERISTSSERGKERRKNKPAELEKSMK